MTTSWTTQVDAFRLIDFGMAVMDALDLQHGDCSNSALVPIFFAFTWGCSRSCCPLNGTH